METPSICEIVRKAETNYSTGRTIISEHVEFSLRENVNKIDAYLNSKHVSGEFDSMGREKPFFNIVTAAVNVWYRATDIDRKDIRIKATKLKDRTAAFLATIHLQDYMKRDAFGTFLNEWGLSLARYGSSVVKFVEKDGLLHASVVPWNRLIVDPIDFNNNVRIEKLYLTPAQLKQNKGYDKEMVDSLLDALVSRKTLDKQRQDNRNDFIEVYEVHGELPLSLITENEKDDDTYVQQMHVVSFVAKKEAGKDEYDDYTLIKGREKKDPYMITHLIKEDGRTQSIGAVEHLFEAQWMQNHSVKAIKDQLDLASKLIFQTSDGAYVGRNVLTAIETGDIMIHEPNQPLTQLQNNSHDITSIQNFQSQWKALGQEITGTPDAVLGKNPPSGQAWRLNQSVLQEAHSLFEIMTENKGLAIEDMLRTYIIPYVKKQMDTTDEISATLSAEQVRQIDAMFLPNEVTKRVNRKIVDAALSNRNMTQADQSQATMQETQGLQQGLSALGAQRFIKPSDIDSVTWKDSLKDLEWDVEVEVTGESSDKSAALDTITTMLQTMGNPATAAVLQTPQGKFLWNKALELTGVVSPIELAEQASAPQPAASPMQAPQQSPISGA